MKDITSIPLLLVSIVALSGCELGDKKSLKECAEAKIGFAYAIKEAVSSEDDTSYALKEAFSSDDKPLPRILRGQPDPSKTMRSNWVESAVAAKRWQDEVCEHTKAPAK